MDARPVPEQVTAEANCAAFRLDQSFGMNAGAATLAAVSHERQLQNWRTNLWGQLLGPQWPSALWGGSAWFSSLCIQLQTVVRFIDSSWLGGRLWRFPNKNPSSFLFLLTHFKIGLLETAQGSPAQGLVAPFVGGRSTSDGQMTPFPLSIFPFFPPHMLFIIIVAMLIPNKRHTETKEGQFPPVPLVHVVTVTGTLVYLGHFGQWRLTESKHLFPNDSHARLGLGPCFPPLRALSIS